MYDYYTRVHKINNLLWVWNCRLREGYPGDEYVDVISVDIYLPDVKMLEESHTPWAYYMAWSKEFCIGEQYNSVESLKAMYASDYAIVAENKM
ncbi:MAG: glycosyl hydrolase [Lachnospiraceae bacterium]|nr:glycosyl hydrolase [Lachnospiraceae bacterium]